MAKRSVTGLWLLLAVLAFANLAIAADTRVPAGLPSGERWLAHMNQDLLPFWTSPAALGNPVGEFPSTRCDDGSALDFKKPCAPISGNSYLMTQALYLVPLSRQTYGYGVAYHLTGERKYLEYAKAGVDYIRKNAIDPAGGMFTTKSLTSGTWGPARELRNPQELGYGLLGLAFYYYLTRDDAVLQDILRIKDYIFNSYYNPATGTMRWQLPAAGASAEEKRLVADLDQVNTYLVLVTPLLPEPYQTQWKQTLLQYAHSMLATFYSPPDNLFFLQADTARQRDIAFTGVDVGHSAKALWMIRWTGLLTGDQGLVQFAEARARRLLDRSYIPEPDGTGSWAGGVKAGGDLDKNKSWWVYDELDQLSATLAVTDPAVGTYLPQTNDFWFRYFVDKQYGEVWNGVNYADYSPVRDYPKAWQWKSAYHDMEHVLIGYISSQWLAGAPAKLYYAFPQTTSQASIHAYYFPVGADAVTVTRDETGQSYQAVTFQPPAKSPAPQTVVVSAATNWAGPLAAGSFASAWGAGLASDVASTTVTVTDRQGVARPALVTHASKSQVNFRIPPETASGSATVAIQAAGSAATRIAVEITAAMPGIFELNAGALAAAIVVRVRPNQPQAIENVYQVAGNAVVPYPIDLSTGAVYLSLFGTGFANAKTVAVTVGGQQVPLLYAGTQAGTGLDQINVGPVPAALAGRGKVNVIVTADGQTANPVELAVR